MATTQRSMETLKLMHAIDRLLYILLVRELARDPSECMEIMALWLWFERGVCSNVIRSISSLSPNLINSLADEAVLCLRCLSNQFPLTHHAPIIPLTSTLVDKDISLQYFLENRLFVFHEIQRLLCDVYIPLLTDIMETARNGGFIQNPIQRPIAAAVAGPSRGPMRFSAPPPPPPPPTYLSARARARQAEAIRASRTMFATFSKGYPVTEDEVREFFRRMFGNCIDSLYMQEVGGDEQALFAKIVFLRPSFVRVILNGELTAKFNINGKHVWMRQFVPRGGRDTRPCGCPSVGPSNCPHMMM